MDIPQGFFILVALVYTFFILQYFPTQYSIQNIIKAIPGMKNLQLTPHGLTIPFLAA